MRKTKETHTFDFRPLGLAIREARERAGLSRNDLGDKVFYGERHIADIENVGSHPSFQLFQCLISFYTYAERAAVYIFGEKSRIIVKLLWVAMIVVGSQTTLGFAWDLADTINGLMIIPNLVGLILLSGEVVKLKNEYLGQRLPVHK